MNVHSFKKTLASGAGHDIQDYGDEDDDEAIAPAVDHEGQLSSKGIHPKHSAIPYGPIISSTFISRIKSPSPPHSLILPVETASLSCLVHHS
jgi:hypothetical protein